MPNSAQSAPSASLRGARSAISRLIRSIKKETDTVNGIDPSTPSVESVDKAEDCLTALNELTNRLDDNINSYLALCDADSDVDDNVIDAEISEYQDVSIETVSFTARLSNKIKRMKLRLQPVTPNTVNDQSGSQILPNYSAETPVTPVFPPPAQFFPTTPTPSCKVKLPKLELRKFGGDVLQWAEFWDSFDTNSVSSVDTNSSLQDIDRLNYLLAQLEGEARTAVSGLKITETNYTAVVSILKQRFGDKQIAINALHTRLMRLPNASDQTPKLRILYGDLECFLRSLHAPCETVTDNNHLVALIMSKLPREVLVTLERNKSSHIPWSLGLIREKLLGELNARESVERYQTLAASRTPSVDKGSRTSFGNNQDTNRYHNSRPQQPFSKSTDGALVASDNRKQPRSQPQQRKCVYCEGSHWSDQCRKYTTVNARKAQLRDCCYICLGSDHRMSACTVKCTCPYCQKIGNHHRSLCIMKFPYNREPVAIASELQETASATAVDSPKTTDTSNSTLLSVGERVMLQTATSTVKNPKMTNSESARILMDYGSNRSYITSDLAKKLKLFCTAGDAISVNRFAAHKTVTVATKYAEIELLCRDGSKLRLSVNVVPTITGTIQRAQLNLPTFKRLCKDLPLADTLPLKSELTSVQLLISNDYYSDIITGEKMQLHPGLYLLGSQIGWVLSGRLQETPCPKDPNVALFVHSQSNFAPQGIFKAVPPKADDCLNISPDIQDLWKLESIGITNCPETSDDEAAQAAFDSTVKFENERYQVTWPWKREPDVLPENYQPALGRLKSLLTRAKQVPELMDKYKDVISDQLKKGVIEPIDETVETGPFKHYIPHHAVITPQKTTTKIRIVYDASTKTRKDNPSLNECLYRGPVYLENLCGLLLRFRTPPLILLSDIEKAFLQVGLQPKDRDVTRFLWLRNSDELHTDKNVQIYRFCRVPFGMISSPFLLGATIVPHLKQYDDPVATEIRHNLYVDNVMIGATDTAAAVCTYKKAKQIFHDASMNLREWVSNYQEFQATLPDDDRVKSTKVKVLGLSWDTEIDTMSVPEFEFPSEILTKRHVLKTVAQVFDPLGLFLPITIMGKLYLQKLWVNELSWDCPIPSELINEWSPIFAALKEIPSLQMKRFLDIDKNRE